MLHNKTIPFKRIIKFRDSFLPVNLSLRCWLSGEAVHRCFSKQVLFKISQFSQENTCAGPCRPSLTEHLSWLLLDFRGSKYFFSGESGIYCGVSHRFLLRTPLKSRLKPQKQPLKLFCEKGVLRNFANFTGKHLCWSFFLIELQEVCSFIKKRLRHRCFPEEFTKFLKTPNLKTVNDCFWNLFFHMCCPF